MNSPGAFSNLSAVRQDQTKETKLTNIAGVTGIGASRGLERVFDLRCLEGRRFRRPAINVLPVR